MATNTRNRGKRRGSASVNTGANKKELKMKLTPEEFFALEKFQFELKILKLTSESIDKERRIKTLARRIHELEQALENHKLDKNNNKIKLTEQKLQEKRKEIANRLGVESLDKYFVDDETYEVIHEDSIIQN